MAEILDGEDIFINGAPLREGIDYKCRKFDNGSVMIAFDIRGILRELKNPNRFNLAIVPKMITANDARKREKAEYERQHPRAI